MDKSRAYETFNHPREAAPSPLLFEAINWSQVADSLEQSTLEYAAQAIGKDSSSGVAYASAALVIDALKRAIREGLE